MSWMRVGGEEVEVGKGLGAFSPLPFTPYGSGRGTSSPRLDLFPILLLALVVEKSKLSPWYSRGGEKARERGWEAVLAGKLRGRRGLAGRDCPPPTPPPPVPSASTWLSRPRLRSCRAEAKGAGPGRRPTLAGVQPQAYSTHPQAYLLNSLQIVT